MMLSNRSESSRLEFTRDAFGVIPILIVSALVITATVLFLLASQHSHNSREMVTSRDSRDMEIVGDALAETTCRGAIITRLPDPEYRITIGEDGKPNIVGISGLYGFRVVCDDGRVGFATRTDATKQFVTFSPK